AQMGSQRPRSPEDGHAPVRRDEHDHAGPSGLSSDVDADDRPFADGHDSSSSGTPQVQKTPSGEASARLPNSTRASRASSGVASPMRSLRSAGAKGGGRARGGAGR